ncbi:MAG: hypothetical protein AB8B41_00480 [Prochlorococcus sp.]
MTSWNRGCLLGVKFDLGESRLMSTLLVVYGDLGVASLSAPLNY